MKNKTLPLIILGLLLLALVIYSFVQRNEINTKAKTIEQMDEKIGGLELDLQRETESKEIAIEKSEELAEANVQLEEEKAVLNKEINKLQKEIKNLKLRISTQRETIEGIRANIKEKENKILALESEISGLNRKKKSDLAKIKQLESEKKDLNSGLDKLQDERVVFLYQKDSLVNQMLDKQDEEELYKSKMEIIQNTSVTFQLVSPRSTKNGKEIKRIKKNNWQFTIFELSMYHDDMKLIENENFVLKIVDSRTRVPLAIRQSNPAYPDSPNNEKAVPFVFTKNPLALEHYNDENKKGNSYEANIYYVVDGKEFLLNHGVVRLAEGGKFIPIGYQPAQGGE